MKEFGLYTIKQSYIDKVSRIDPNIVDMKGTKRPFICIKDNEQKNWLIPVASIDPGKEQEYKKKVSKYKNFLSLDKKQAIDDSNPMLRAIHIVGDITKLRKDENFRSVIEYYNIIPVKHKYCKKYKNYNHNHIVLSDPKLCKMVKKVFRLNLSERQKGNFVGFIKHKIALGEKDYKDYPIRSIEIREVLYKEHTKRLRKDAERKEVARQRTEEKQRKKELRQAARQQTAILSAQSMNREQQIAELISVCRQRIANEINRDQARERQAEQARQAQQVEQAKPFSANMPKGKATGKAPRGK